MRSIQTFILSLVFSLLCVNAFSRSSNDSILIPLEEIVNIEVGDNGGLFTNDIIVRSGIFTIPTNVTLTMRKPYRIYVMDGATLHINGGQIVNADIVIKNGGSIKISNDALIEIREQGGNLNLENGAILNYIKGTIQ